MRSYTIQKNILFTYKNLRKNMTLKQRYQQAGKEASWDIELI